MREIEERCLRQTGRADLCPAVARVLSEIAETCAVRVRRFAAVFPCGLIRSAAAVVFTALDGAVAVVKMHEAVYLVVEIAETGAVTYKIITPEYARMSN